MNCPNCGKKIKERPQKEEVLRYFEHSWGQKLALVLSPSRKKWKLYIDDVEHMGLMTSGPGGY